MGQEDFFFCHAPFCKRRIVSCHGDNESENKPQPRRSCHVFPFRLFVWKHAAEDSDFILFYE